MEGGRELPTSGRSMHIECKPVTGKITYGLERLAMFIPGWVQAFMDPGLEAIGPLGIHLQRWFQNEVEQSTYNFVMPTSISCSPCFEQYARKRPSSCWRGRPRAAASLRRILERLQQHLQPAGCA